MKPSQLTPPVTLLLLLAACRYPVSPGIDEDADSSSGAASSDDGTPDPDTDGPGTTGNDEPVDPPVGETTDDAGASTGDTDDVPATCGNGLADEGEACDNGINDGSYGGCLPDCSGRAPHCGDGVIDEIAGESCDDGNNEGGDACNAWCGVSGSTASSLAGPIVWGQSAIAIGPTGRIFVSMDGTDRLLWEVELDDEHDTLTSVEVHDMPPGVRPVALYALDSARLAVASTLDDSPRHDLRVYDVSSPGDIESSWESLWPTDGSVAGYHGAPTDLFEAGGDLWMVGDLLSSEGLEQIRVHRFDPDTHQVLGRDFNTYVSGGTMPGSHAVTDTTSGLVAVVAEFDGGGFADHTRVHVRHPQTAAQLSWSPSEHHRATAICARPEGGVLMVTHGTGDDPSQFAVGFSIDAGTGAVIQDGLMSLPFGTNTDITACATGEHGVLLLGSVDGDAYAAHVHDPFGPDESVAWEREQLGIDGAVANRAMAAAYRNGRYYVTLGHQLGLVSLVE